MNKQEERVLIKQRLEKLENKEELDKKIYNNLIESKLLKGQNICIYNSLKQEVDTKNIIDYCLSNGYKVFLPVSKEEEMVLVQIDKSTVYKQGKFGILEPMGRECQENIDLCIIPLLGYDLKKHRLGKGKGYYDRFLKDNNCTKIALAYSCQELDLVESMPHDILMDYIVNENGVI